MEKLINLHNDFVHNNKDYALIYYNVEYKCFCFDCCDSFYDFSEGAVSVLISKEYGFIDWLVNEGKVREQWDIEDYRVYNQVELLLMRLSISDNPLDYLILELL